jgi:hypothetical protein
VSGLRVARAKRNLQERCLVPGLKIRILFSQKCCLGAIHRVIVIFPPTILRVPEPYESSSCELANYTLMTEAWKMTHYNSLPPIQWNELHFFSVRSGFCTCTHTAAGSCMHLHSPKESSPELATQRTSIEIYTAIL